MQKIGTEGTKVTTISIDADTLAILDQAQAEWKCSRSEAIRRIVAAWRQEQILLYGDGTTKYIGIINLK